MEILKKLLLSFMTMIICFSLCSCDKNDILTENDMLRYAQEQHGDGLTYSGMSLCGNEAIVWFTFDPMNPSAFAMVFSQNKDGSYTLVRDFNSNFDADACCVLWRNGVAVHIENEDIKELVVGYEKISVTEYPFNIYIKFKENVKTTNIYYIDANGNKVE